MNTEFDKTYANMTNAKRAATQAKLENPVFEDLEDGRVRLTETQPEASAPGRNKVSTTETPVAAFRKLFHDRYGSVPRRQLLKEAAERGIARNTAATYYYKLSKDLQNKQAPKSRAG